MKVSSVEEIVANGPGEYQLTYDYNGQKINVNVKLPPTFLRCKLVTAIHCFAASFYIQFSFIHQYEASSETRGFT